MVVGILRRLLRPRRRFQVSDPGSQERWSIANGEYDGKPLITRFNLALTSLVGDPAYPHQLGIATPFISPTSNGLPTSDEAAELSNLEDNLAAALTAEGESLFAGVITTNNMREYVFYSRDPLTARARFEEVRSSFPSREIQFAVHDDPAWQNFRNFSGSHDAA